MNCLVMMCRYNNDVLQYPLCDVKYVECDKALWALGREKCAEAEVSFLNQPFYIVYFKDGGRLTFNGHEWVMYFE